MPDKIRASQNVLQWRAHILVQNTFLYTRVSQKVHCVCVLETVGRAACFSPTLAGDLYTKKLLKRLKRNQKSPHDISGICVLFSKAWNPAGSLWLRLPSTSAKQRFKISLFTVSRRVRSWRAGERRQTGRTWLQSHRRIYSETPPWGGNKQLLWANDNETIRSARQTYFHVLCHLTSAAGGHEGMQTVPPSPGGWTQWERRTGRTRVPGTKPPEWSPSAAPRASPWPTAPRTALRAEKRACDDEIWCIWCNMNTSWNTHTHTQGHKHISEILNGGLVLPS